MAIHYSNDDTSGSESGDDTNRNNNRPLSSSWRGWKERGKLAYLNGDYASALQNYSQALQRQNNILNNVLAGPTDMHILPSNLDRQVLLSNIVACRLKLGGAPQAEAAVANAKKCISIDNQWAKGHMRLAEAYIALRLCIAGSSNPAEVREKQKDFSNKACDALQRVIDLDRTNQNARNMLTKELRYWAVNDSTSSGEIPPAPSAPPAYMDDNRNPQEQSSNPQQRQNNNTDGIDIEDDNNYVFTPSWQDRIVFKIQKARAWYAGLSDGDKALVKIAAVFVVLYVGFGGRFGLEYLGKSSSPSPRSSSVYDEFYQSRKANYRHYDSNRYDTNYDRYGGSHHRRGQSSWSTSSYGGHNGGHFWYVMLVLGASYIGQRFFGIGPYQALFFVNILLGRRNRGFIPRRRYGWGNGFNFGARPHYRHRPGGMWGW